MVLTDLTKIIFDHHPYYLATKILQFSVNSLCNLCFKFATEIAERKISKKLRKKEKNHYTISRSKLLDDKKIWYVFKQ